MPAATIIIIPASYYLAVLTFGRDSARYWELIAFLALISVVLWILVALTTMIRISFELLLHRRYRHQNASELARTSARQ